MDIVRIKKSKLIKFIFLSILMFIKISAANAVQEVVLTFENNKMKLYLEVATKLVVLIYQLITLVYIE